MNWWAHTYHQFTTSAYLFPNHRQQFQWSFWFCFSNLIFLSSILRQICWFFFLFLLCHSNVCSFSLNLCVHGYNLIIEICWQYHYLWIQAGLSYLIRVLMNLMEQQVWAETHLSRTDAALRPGLCWQTRNQISCWYRNFSECYSFVYVALTKKSALWKKIIL